MPTRPVYLFDDGQESIRPLTGLRASFEVRIGPYSLLERFLREDLAPEGFFIWGVHVPPPLAGLVRERHGVLVNALRSAGTTEPVIVLNGRWAVPDWGRLAILEPGGVLMEHGELVAACVEESRLTRTLGGDLSGLREQRTEFPALLRRPWDARAMRDAALSQGLDAAARSRRFQDVGWAEGRIVLGRAMASPSAKVMPGSIIDAQAGPVIIEEEAVIRPRAVLIGPCFIGPHSTVLEGATIRAGTVLGPWCKVNGEVSGTTFQGFSNKAHEGFIGDSWIGEWVNLGAGTTTSNLLNTYGEVFARARHDGPNERTGQQFLGSIIGDHVKTAIGTRLMTGAVIHTGAMLAAPGPVSGCVRPFAWCTEEGVRRYRRDKFMEVARAAMARRGVALEGAYQRRLEDLLAAPAHDEA
jgi:UDP-N-acetylglucosamine diphosphorylase/glucosamine-1-phosphate N-acetyltransferase